MSQRRITWLACAVLSPLAPCPPAPAGASIPLQLWTSPEWPSGLVFGTNGLTIVDYDGDGWIDVFVPQDARLWRNVGGTSWTLVDLSDVLPTPTLRWGGGAGDWNADGRPDLVAGSRNVCEPFVECEFDECTRLLRNEGAGQFTDVSEIVVDASLCNLEAEPIGFGDVDGDGDLDIFIPAEEVDDSPGNSFLENLGPDDEGVYHFTERAEAVGLRNDVAPTTPEGVQFADVDFDGDLDLFSNAILHRNISSLGAPQFEPMPGSASGINLALKDEGAVFFDYDLDGDYDLGAIYQFQTTVIWENRGDGSFAYPGVIVEAPTTGVFTGVSAADWDNDGDIDFTGTEVFRRNLWMETGQRFFEIAPNPIPLAHRSAAQPAWGDWDADGDLDCVLSNWFDLGRFYENVLYTDTTPRAERRHVRVRCVRDSIDAPAGTETEFGASVEIDVTDDPIRRRRKGFVASAHGSLQQSEYALHFALPADPAPEDPAEDVRFDVIVDFPSLPEVGPWRVDRHVNAALDNINLATLVDREIVVRRSGQVVVDGVEVAPTGRTPQLSVAGGGLIEPDIVTGSAPLVAAEADTWIGLAFDTFGARYRQHVREIVLDGALAAATGCPGTTANIVLWDVTEPTKPFVVAALDGETVPLIRNRRIRFTVDVLLDLNRDYRAVANVTFLRATPFAGPVSHDDLTVTGGLRFTDADPCPGVGVTGATVDASQRYLTVVYGAASAGADIDGDGSVAFADLTLLLTAWGPCDGCPEDIDGDGEVAFADLTMLLNGWG